MKFELPTKVSQETLSIDAREVEAILQGPALDIPPFPETMLTLKDGRTLYIRQAKMDEVQPMLDYMDKLMKVDHDFYDIVGSRVYSEILAWKRKRLKDQYVLVGLIDGVWSGFANGRLMNEDINVSLHTMALQRGGRIGAAMYFAKIFYGFEIVKNTEWWATYESYNGWKRWGLGMAQPSYPWPDVQHELGGGRVFYVTTKYWKSTVKDYVRQMVGADLNFEVTDEVRKANEKFIVPDKLLV